MKKVRIALRIWWFELRTIVLSSRWVMLTMLTCFLTWFYLRDYLNFARAYDLPLSPAGMPFIFADRIFNSLGLLILIFLVSAFPVTGHFQQGILVKGGNGCWMAGQSLTVVSVVFLWLAEMQFFFILLSGRRLTLRGWGQVWGSFANGKALELGYGSAGSISMEVIMGYTPVQAIFLNMLFVGLTGIVFGEFIFCVDGLCKNYIGEILLAAWGVGNLLISSFGDLSRVRFLGRLSPVGWMDISEYIGDAGKAAGNLALLVLLGVVLHLVNYCLVKSKRIEVA